MKVSPAILVVDDELDLREGFASILRSGGYSVETASDGAQALELLMRGLRPSLIILDLMMEGVNGWQFRSAQLADPKLVDIPVIIVTGGTEHPMDPVLQGVAGLLRKPIDPDGLLGTVSRIVRDFR